MKKKTYQAFAVLAMLPLLSACVTIDMSQKNALNIRAATNADNVSSYIEAEDSPSYGFDDDRNKIFYIAIGSSSCPPEIADARYDEEEEKIIIHVRDTYYGNCTTDAVSLVQIITKKDGTGFSDNDTIELK